MNDLAIAYHEWSQEITYDRDTYKFLKGKGRDLIRTRGGDLYTREEWMKKALAYVKENGLTDLYLQVRQYVVNKHLWLKKSDVIEHSLDCVLHESYKAWKDFSYQARLKV